MSQRHFSLSPFPVHVWHLTDKSCTCVYFEEQETSDKELSALAKRTLQLLNSAAPYDIDHVGGAVAAVLGAANDTNWHTRVSALTFLQSLVYRCVVFGSSHIRDKSETSLFPYHLCTQGQESAGGPIM
jgi:hypothetical protein